MAERFNDTPVNPDDNDLSNRLMEPQSRMPTSTGASGTYPVLGKSGNEVMESANLDMENKNNT
jgi:hypothetical protein